MRPNRAEVTGLDGQAAPTLEEHPWCDSPLCIWCNDEAWYEQFKFMMLFGQSMRDSMSRSREESEQSNDGG